jgi:hypothetical protein
LCSSLDQFSPSRDLFSETARLWIIDGFISVMGLVAVSAAACKLIDWTYSFTGDDDSSLNFYCAGDGMPGQDELPRDSNRHATSNENSNAGKNVWGPQSRFSLEQKLSGRTK